MYSVLVGFVLFMSSKTLATYVINAGNFLKEELDAATPKRPPPDFNIERFLKGYGYPFENHEVKTEDGYILGLHRIPYGRNESGNTSKTKTKPTVLIMHGICSSSVDFFILGPDRSLALMLADIGYDVWLGNNRGTTWSRKHVKLDPDEDELFWDYSFHDLGTYDTPAIVDYILKETGKEEISYIAHSQGTTQFFVMTSTKPEYNDKINVMLAFAPPVFMQNLTNPIIQIVKDYYTVFDLAATFLNITEVLPHSEFLTDILETLCRSESEYQEMCITFFFSVLGFDTEQLNRTEFSMFLENFPAGTSLKEYKHYLQEVKSGHFRQYDYGWIENMIVYKQAEPPDYDLSKVTVPIAIYYGQNDWLVGTPDIDRLAKSLANVIGKKIIDYKWFNHGDFIIAKDVFPLLYFDVINLLNKYNGLTPIVSTTLTTPTAAKTSTRTTPRGTTTTPTPITRQTSPRTRTTIGFTTQPHSTTSPLTTTPSSSSKIMAQILWVYVASMIIKLLM